MVLRKAAKLYVTALVVGLGGIATAGPVAADGFNPMNVMNPSKWFGGNRNRPDLDDLPPPPPPGYAPPPGAPYGAPPPGPGYGALPPPNAAPYAPGPQPPLYNPVPPAQPPVDYAVPQQGGYGTAPATAYGATPGYATPTYGGNSAPGYAAPETGPSREEMAGRIQELEQRLEEMEAKSRNATPAPMPTAPQPARYQYYSGEQSAEEDQSQKYPFRPMDLGR